MNELSKRNALASIHSFPRASVEPARPSKRARRTRAWFGVCIATLVLTACGDDAPPKAPSSSAAPAAADAAPRAGAASGFNVLLVTLDTVRADALGCYGDAKAHTPVLDRLAQTGARFERALAPAPITLPAHSTLMTGLDPLSHGVRNNGTFRLAAEQLTLAERLAAQGYATGAVVSAFVLDARFGLDQGFGSYDDDLHLDSAAPREGMFRERRANKVTDRAREWLAAHERTAPDKPFFLWAHYFDAHYPYEAPAQFLPPGVSNDPGQPYSAERIRAQYLAEVAFVDAELGRLLEALGPEKLARTLVVVTADHGESLGAHGEHTHSRLIYDGVMRVPLIVSSPTLFPTAQHVTTRVVGLVDVAPTVLELLGVAPGEARFDGRSLFDATPDPERAIYGESLVTYYNHGWAPLHSLTRLEDKVIRAPRSEHYDLKRDPLELDNLMLKAPQRGQALLTRLERLTGAATAPAESGLSADDARELAALGYTRSEPQQGAAQVDPKDAIVTWALLTNAQAASVAGRHDDALREIRKVLAQHPGDAFAWEAEYAVHNRRGALDDARAALEHVIELSPSAEAYVRMAWLQLQLERRAECERALSAAALLEPEHGDIALIRGEWLFRERRFAEAKEQFQRAIAIDPARTTERAGMGIRAVESALAGQR